MPGAGLGVGNMGSWKQFRARLYTSETFPYCLCPPTPRLWYFPCLTPSFSDYPIKNSCSITWCHSTLCLRWCDLTSYLQPSYEACTVGLLRSTNFCSWPQLWTDVNFHLILYVSSPHIKWSQIKILLILNFFASSIFFISFNDCHLHVCDQGRVCQLFLLPPGCLWRPVRCPTKIPAVSDSLFSYSPTSWHHWTIIFTWTISKYLKYLNLSFILELKIWNYMNYNLSQ